MLFDVPVVVASSLVGAWAFAGYVGGVRVMAGGVRRRRRMDPAPPLAVPTIDLEGFDLDDWRERHAEAMDQEAAYAYGGGLDPQGDMEWWRVMQGRNASMDACACQLGEGMVL